MQERLKKDLTIQVLNYTEYCLKEKKKVIGLIKDRLGKQILKEFVGVRAKTYSYLKDNNDEDKKSKKHKKVCHKKKT